MDKKRKITSIVVFLVIIAIFFIASISLPSHEGEDIQVMMRDAVLHEENQVYFLGLYLNPGLISAFIVSGFLIVVAIILRIFVVPRFTIIPGKVQMVIETIVGLFSGMAKEASPHRNKFLTAYMTIVGTYIFTGTIFELFGIQVVATSGVSISLPAPLSDINGAITMGCLTYMVIMVGGARVNGIKGIGQTLKDFSLPISMSFRLFGALLSGALVTELVYHFSSLSYGVPVVVGVIFTLLHALIQAYVLTMLVSIFYGEVTEVHEKKEKKKKINVNELKTEEN